MSRKHVVEGLFAETEHGPRLLGSKCASCATPYFPRSPVCHNPDCTHSAVADAEFGPHGKLWGFTIQTYPPPPPTKYDEPFKPYAMGFIDLDDGLRVLGRVKADDLASIEVGMKVDLIIAPIFHDSDGAEVVTWQFKPV
jgi:uncharacterized OB-fold protein